MKDFPATTQLMIIKYLSDIMQGYITYQLKNKLRKCEGLGYFYLKWMELKLLLFCRFPSFPPCNQGDWKMCLIKIGLSKITYSFQILFKLGLKLLFCRFHHVCMYVTKISARFRPIFHFELNEKRSRAEPKNLQQVFRLGSDSSLLAICRLSMSTS